MVPADLTVLSPQQNYSVCLLLLLVFLLLAEFHGGVFLPFVI